MQDWEQKLEFMRRCGVTKAKWDGETLVECELGADPASQDSPESASPEAPREESALPIIRGSSRLVRVTRDAV